MPKSYDAVVVGAGPNGLAAAITLAQAGRSVLVREASATIGGGARSAELTLPGYIHDICSAIHPLSRISPFLRGLDLAAHGLQWVDPPAALAHPLDDGPAVIVERSVEATAATLGPDAAAYRRLMQPFVGHWAEMADDLLGPLPLPPRHPILMARFGLKGGWPAAWVKRANFRGVRAPALFAGSAAHSMLPLSALLTAAVGLLIGGSAHAVGWPLARQGSQSIADALAGLLRSLGGEIETNAPVTNVDELPPARHILFDLTPRQVVKIAGHKLPSGYVRRLQGFRYGVGVFKLDYALDGPIPWRDPAILRAATAHLGGTFGEIAAGEAAVWRGEHPERPFVLLAQASLFDEARAPAGKHTVWAYCHVPHGSTVDMSERVTAQIERFAPGFRDRILAVSKRGPAEVEAHNPNYIGGDINGGVQDWRQFFTRPVARAVPYSTPNPQLYFCSSSTPPGGGVHGMCGYHAARAVLRASRG
ncbi:MAG: NAD(P)/FAD-dependent oxidoreductase [Anaerolineales bacterium]|nr:NAD(P)/FAD-dependent oxidoreductase [Anaerolineales bacterium]